jgi:hypothetical protein
MVCFVLELVSLLSKDRSSDFISFLLSLWPETLFVAALDDRHAGWCELLVIQETSCPWGS